MSLSRWPNMLKTTSTQCQKHFLHLIIGQVERLEWKHLCSLLGKAWPDNHKTGKICQFGGCDSNISTVTQSQYIRIFCIKNWEIWNLVSEYTLKRCLSVPRLWLDLSWGCYASLSNIYLEFTYILCEQRRDLNICSQTPGVENERFLKNIWKTFASAGDGPLPAFAHMRPCLLLHIVNMFIFCSREPLN